MVSEQKRICIDALVDSTEGSYRKRFFLTTKQIRNVDNGFRAFYFQ